MTFTSYYLETSRPSRIGPGDTEIGRRHHPGSREGTRWREDGRGSRAIREMERGSEIGRDGREVKGSSVRDPNSKGRGSPVDLLSPKVFFFYSRWEFVEDVHREVFGSPVDFPTPYNPPFSPPCYLTDPAFNFRVTHLVDV